LYLERININDESESLVYPSINMTKPQAQDAFYVLTQHLLKVEYDKNNVYYSEENFVKKKGKSIPNHEKWMKALSALGQFGMYPLIITFAFGTHSYFGRHMAITMLMTMTYVCWELKRPSDVSENWAIDMFN
jgi:hypothetical protein